MLFFRIFQHLLPRARAWNLVAQKRLRQFFEGLSEKPKEIRNYTDLVYEDMFPQTTRELAAWERQFGIEAASTDSARRSNLEAAWQSQGGQDRQYIEGILAAAGFDVTLHEWWSSGPPFVARDPRNHATSALIGSNQCQALPTTETKPQCKGLLDGPDLCDRLLVTDPGYLVNKSLGTATFAPPPIPDDPDRWPYFIYVGDTTFPNRVTIPLSRKDEFERLLLKLCPAQHWIVLLVDYSTDFGIFDDTFDASFE